MASRRLQLEVFDVPSSPLGSIELSSEALETVKLETYEKGYAAGWEDLLKNEAEALAAIRADISSALQQIGFTVQEAKSDILQSLKPFLYAVTEFVMPMLCGATVKDHIVAALQNEAACSANIELTLLVHPELAAVAEEAIFQQSSIKAVVQKDENLERASVVLLRNAGETILNTDQLCVDIKKAVFKFLDDLKEEE